MRWLIIFGLLLVSSSSALAQECPQGATCVDKSDMSTFLKLAQDHSCRASQAPAVTSDGVTIVVDRMGRVYGSGTGPRPFKLHLDWCNYKIDATTNLNVLAAQRMDPNWGFRLRLKATVGGLLTEAFRAPKAYEALDGGILVEPFYYYWANLNAYVGVRSVGVGVGFDIFKNVSLYVGYGVTWGSWRSSPYLGVGFSLW